MRTVRDWCLYVIVRIFVCTVQSLSIQTCQSIARLLSFLATDVLKIRRTLVEQNLSGAFPVWTPSKRHEVTRQMWEHLFLMVCEIAHAPRKVHPTNWRRYVTIQHRREIVEQLLDRRPTILVSGHFGDFELAGYFCAMLGFRSYTIARRLDNPFLDRYINRFRGRTGQFILPKDGSSRQVQAILESGGTLALLGDQHAGPKGCWVNFMGRPASCHKAVALFSLSSGGPLLVVSARRTNGPMKFAIELVGIADPLNAGPDTAGIKPLTQWYNQMLETMIRMAPDQYWWLHRRWREPPAKLTLKVLSGEESPVLRKPAA